jgi:adenylate cyclase
VARQIQNKITLPVLKLGRGELKNIRTPVDIYRLVMPDEHRHFPIRERIAFSLRRKAVRRVAITGAAFALAVGGVAAWQMTRLAGPHALFSSNDPVLALPKGPSIAVLPFANLSGDPKEEYFADGISEEIITQLTQFRELFVIARNSTFQYKGKAVDIKQIGRELGVRYVLEGSVRKGAGGIRVTAQLIDAASGAHLWAETYDRTLTASNVIGVQDEITGQVVAKIAEPYGVISRAGVKEAQRKGPGSLSSYECALLAREFYSTESSPVMHLRARDCLERALAVEPDYVDAWVWLSLIYVEEYRFGYNPRPTPPALDRALQTARRATEIDPANAMAHFVLALAYYNRHELEPFAVEAEKALKLSPNTPVMLAELGHLFGEMGQGDRGVAMTRKAMALNPHHPSWYWANVSNYYYTRRDYEQALAAALKWNDPDFYHSQMHLARAYGQLGRKKEAQAAAARLLKLYPDFPQKVREELRRWTSDEPGIEHVVEGLRKAGLEIPPE